MVGRPVHEGLRGRAFFVRRLSIRKGHPSRLELGPHQSWKVLNPAVAAPLRLRQVDRVEDTVWLCADGHLPGEARHVFLEVDRGDVREKIGLVVVCEEA